MISAVRVWASEPVGVDHRGDEQAELHDQRQDQPQVAHEDHDRGHGEGHAGGEHQHHQQEQRHVERLDLRSESEHREQHQQHQRGQQRVDGRIRHRGDREYLAGAVELVQERHVGDQALAPGRHARGEERPRQQAEVREQRVGRGAGIDVGELGEDQRERQHHRHRRQQRPHQPQHGLLVADPQIALGERYDQLAVVPQLPQRGGEAEVAAEPDLGAWLGRRVRARRIERRSFYPPPDSHLRASSFQHCDPY